MLAARRALPAGIATLVLLLALADLTQHYVVTAVPVLVLAVGCAAPLLAVGRRPVAAWTVCLAVSTLTAVSSTPVSPAEPWPWTVSGTLAILVTLVAVGGRAPVRTAVLVGVSTQVPGAVLVVARPVPGGVGSLLAVAVLSTAVLVAAEAWRGRREARHRLAVEERLSADERARRARLEERAHLAREMHDVVAHHLSSISVRAASAPVRVHDLTEAGTEFRALAESARASLAEMRRLLGVLRDEDAAGARAPQPGLRDLADLVAETTRAGTPTTLTERRREPVPDAVGLTAYRIVQEALSNVVRHAPDASVTVTVDHVDGHLELDVVNTPSRPGPDTTGAGFGLVGMRERTDALGGTVQAEARTDGSFAVRALLPTAARYGA